MYTSFQASTHDFPVSKDNHGRCSVFPTSDRLACRSALSADRGARSLGQFTSVAFPPNSNGGVARDILEGSWRVQFFAFKETMLFGSLVARETARDDARRQTERLERQTVSGGSVEQETDIRVANGWRSLGRNQSIWAFDINPRLDII